MELARGPGNKEHDKGLSVAKRNRRSLPAFWNFLYLVTFRNQGFCFRRWTEKLDILLGIYYKLSSFKPKVFIYSASFEIRWCWLLSSCSFEKKKEMSYQLMGAGLVSSLRRDQTNPAEHRATYLWKEEEGILSPTECINLWSLKETEEMNQEKGLV